MSKSHRRHESPSRTAKRGPSPKDHHLKDPIRKTHKQQRPNERVALRKEYR